MGKYKRVDRTPCGQISFSTMKLFKVCRDKERVWNAYLRFFDWIRIRDNAEPEPPEPDFADDFSREVYDCMVEDTSKGVENYWSRCATNADNRNGSGDDGRPWSTNEPITNEPMNDLPNDSSNDSTTYPTLAEVQRECIENGYWVKAEDFFEEMSRQGWKDRGGSVVKDWRKLYKSWNDRPQREAFRPVRAQQYEQRSYSEDQLADLSEGDKMIIAALEAEANKK